MSLRTVSIAMKKISLSIIALMYCLSALCQEKSWYMESFMNSFAKRFKVPMVVWDSCLLNNTLLRVYIDKNFNPTIIEFSDNALDPFKKELDRILTKLDTKSLKDHLRLTGRKGINVIFPIFFVNKACDCNTRHDKEQWYSESYSRFKGKLLENTCILEEPIQFIIFDRVY